MVAGGGVLGAVAGDARCGPPCGMGGLGRSEGRQLARRPYLRCGRQLDWSPEGKNFGEKALNLAKDFGSALEDTFNPFD
jgi:hypothetical protein